MKVGFYKLHFALYLFFVSIVASAQERFTELRNISPTDTNFNDLQGFSPQLNGVITIALGEQSHGDGAAFDAKVRIIKYLHEKEGFNVLAFESGFYDCYKQNIQFQQNPNDTNGLFNAIFGIWDTKEVQQLSEYISATHKTERPLTIIGFDCQFTGKFGKTDLISNFIEAAIYLNNTYQVNVLEDSTHLFPALRNTVKYSNYFKKLSVADTTVLHKYLGSILAITNNNDSILQFWQMMSRNMITNYQMKYTKDNIRDSVMAKNYLEIIADPKYANEKIIIWAANYHIAYKKHEVPQDVMGSYVKRELKDKYYSLLITSHTGKAMAGIIKWKVNKTPPNSAEAYFATFPIDYALIYFKTMQKIPDAYLQKTKVFGHSGSENDITTIADGVLFIRKMYPKRWR